MIESFANKRQFAVGGSQMQAHSSLLTAQGRKRIKSLSLSAVSYQLSAIRESSDLKRSAPQGPPMADRSSSRAEDGTLRALRIVIAGGGTGGHLFPGVAMAQEFMTRNPQNCMLFVSTGNPLERSVLSQAGFDLECITAEGIKGRGLWNQAKSMVKIPKGIFESIRILRKFKPVLIIGLGSYSAGPVVMGAWLLGIKIVLHEQNILPGITNRMLSRIADRIYISFENSGTHFDPRKVVWTGNPVRKDIIASPRNHTRPTAMQPGQLPFTVLIIGGSQGAHSINMAVMEAIEYLKDRTNIHFVHQTGSADEDLVKDAYRRFGISSTVQSFFSNMAEQYHKADLIICRAGATTVAEITAIGKTAIFVPFPYAADDHQVLNAQDLTKKGAAEMIIEKDLSGKVLSEKILYYAADPAVLADMAAKARSCGKPDAVQRIVDDCYRLVD